MPHNLSIPQIMGILNVTPDSFFDGGRYSDPHDAITHALKMIAEGAAIIDVGGESTRPGAQPLSLQQELDRVIPVIEAIRRESAVIISIDTYKLAVMRAAIQAGANFINDVRALREPGTLEFAALANVPVCLMHMQGAPQSMQADPQYDDVYAQVSEFLHERVAAAVAAGIKRENLIIDPGIGFGKKLPHNLRLLQTIKNLGESLGLPVLLGASRKSMLGDILGVQAEQRLYGGLALAAWGLMQGATIIRTHDVQATVEVMKVLTCLTAEGN